VTTVIQAKHLWRVDVLAGDTEACANWLYEARRLRAGSNP